MGEQADAGVGGIEALSPAAAKKKLSAQVEANQVARFKFTQDALPDG